MTDSEIKEQLIFVFSQKRERGAGQTHLDREERQGQGDPQQGGVLARSVEVTRAP